MEPEITDERRRLGYVGVDSRTRKTVNQDYCNSFTGKRCRALAIADGLGSSFDAHIAAEVCVTSFLEEVKAIDVDGREVSLKDIKNIWERIAENLAHCLRIDENRYVDKSNPLQTTLLTVIDLDSSYIVSYLGNGSILYLRGNFWHFWDHRWPWCLTDLMVSHTVLQDGKDVLSGILAPESLRGSVSSLELSKDSDSGEILILCSDGINSSEQLRIGRDPDNKLWIEVNPHIESLVNDFFRDFFQKIAKGADPDKELTKTVATFLDERKDAFKDDATLGIIVSRNAIEKYKSRSEQP